MNMDVDDDVSSFIDEVSTKSIEQNEKNTMISDDKEKQKHHLDKLVRNAGSTQNYIQHHQQRTQRTQRKRATMLHTPPPTMESMSFIDDNMEPPETPPGAAAAAAAAATARPTSTHNSDSSSDSSSSMMMIDEDDGSYALRLQAYGNFNRSSPEYSSGTFQRNFVSLYNVRYHNEEEEDYEGDDDDDVSIPSEEDDEVPFESSPALSRFKKQFQMDTATTTVMEESIHHHENETNATPTITHSPKIGLTLPPKLRLSPNLDDVPGVVSVISNLKIRLHSDDNAIEDDNTSGDEYVLKVPDSPLSLDDPEVDSPNVIHHHEHYTTPPKRKKKHSVLVPSFYPTLSSESKAPSSPLIMDLPGGKRKDAAKSSTIFREVVMTTTSGDLPVSPSTASTPTTALWSSPSLASPGQPHQPLSPPRSRFVSSKLVFRPKQSAISAPAATRENGEAVENGDGTQRRRRMMLRRRGGLGRGRRPMDHSLDNPSCNQYPNQVETYEAGVDDVASSVKRVVEHVTINGQPVPLQVDKTQIVSILNGSTKEDEVARELDPPKNAVFTLNSSDESIRRAESSSNQSNNTANSSHGNRRSGSSNAARLHRPVISVGSIVGQSRVVGVSSETPSFVAFNREQRQAQLFADEKLQESALSQTIDEHLHFTMEEDFDAYPTLERSASSSSNTSGGLPRVRRRARLKRELKLVYRSIADPILQRIPPLLSFVPSKAASSTKKKGTKRNAVDLQRSNTGVLA